MDEPFDPSLLKLLLDKGDQAVPMHMPGHMRNVENLPPALPWSVDLTEVPPFDNLQSPRGILKDCQELAVSVWNSRRAFFLVGGSTAGILAGIRACTRRGGRILMARNSHMSVYNAVELCGLKPVFLDPPLVNPYGFCGSIPPEQVGQKLSEYPDIQLAVLPSPTYEGVLSDIGAIAALLHKRDLPLFVDEAHGAHLGFAGFPAGALEQGADLVVHSLHKTLPSLTQTGLLHIGSHRIPPGDVSRQLALFQSSSPSYPLMASIDYCCRLMKDRGDEMSRRHMERLEGLRRGLRGLRRLELAPTLPSVQAHGFDPAKLVLYTLGGGLSGHAAAERLRRRHNIKAELACRRYFLAMTTLYSRPEDFSLFERALYQLDEGLQEPETLPGPAEPVPFGRQIMDFEQAMAAPGRAVPLSQAAGRISREYVWKYPPGIPVLAPGQRISEGLVAGLLAYARAEDYSSSFGGLPERIHVLDNKIPLK